MTNEIFVKAKRLKKDYEAHQYKIKELLELLDKTKVTAYDNEYVLVSVYNGGGGTKKDVYIPKGFVADMIRGAIKYYTDLSEEVEEQFRCL